MDTFFLLCNNEIKRILAKYPPYYHPCLFEHKDEIVLECLYDLCHCLMVGKTKQEIDREDAIAKALRNKRKHEKISH